MCTNFAPASEDTGNLKYHLSYVYFPRLPCKLTTDRVPKKPALLRTQSASEHCTQQQGVDDLGNNNLQGHREKQ